MKRMLFNATQSEELRVAIVDRQKLIDLDIEHSGKEERKSNIYKGIITRVEPSLEAAFVDYGAERHGFLPFKDISRSYFTDKQENNSRPRIQDAIKEGQEVIVQVDKDERGTKGAALTTYISLAGRYLVLMPNNPRGGGVSRRVEGEDRNKLRDIIAELNIPKEMSVIARTAGIDRTSEELQWDLNYLLQLWNAIAGAGKEKFNDKGERLNPAPDLIYLESNLVIRAIRDYFSDDIGEILIDTVETFEQAQHFMKAVMPDSETKVKHYVDETPLFSRFQIEHQIETAFSREVRLPSGGAVVIDHTEALVSIDVNSGRSIKGADIEQTAFNTNVEAAEEVARQLRLRDLGGLVVVDFIDMENQRNQRDVENALRDALHADRARVQTSKISRFGLLELSRQRLRSSLGENNHIPCPRCHGTGHIRGIESTALHILRITQEEAMKENSAAIQVQLPIDAATFLLNEKRAEIHQIEQDMGVDVILIPNIHLETPNYSILRLKQNEVSDEDVKASYNLVEAPKEEAYIAKMKTEESVSAPEPAVKNITSIITPIASGSGLTRNQSKMSLFDRIKKWLGSESQAKMDKKPETKKPQRRDNNRNRNRSNYGRKRNDKQTHLSNLDKKNKSENAQVKNNRHESRGEKTNQNGSNNKSQEGNNQPPRQKRGNQSRGNRLNRKAHSENQAADQTESKQLAVATQSPNTDAARPANSDADIKQSIKAISKPAEKKVATDTSADTKPIAEKKVKTTNKKAKPAKAKAVEKEMEGAKEVKADKNPAKPKAKTRKPKTSKPVDLAASGLELVETKVKPAPKKATKAIVKPKAKTPRKPKNWGKDTVKKQADEPLVMVETQKK